MVAILVTFAVTFPVAVLWINAIERHLDAPITLPSAYIIKALKKDKK